MCTHSRKSHALRARPLRGGRGRSALYPNFQEGETGVETPHLLGSKENDRVQCLGVSLETIYTPTTKMDLTVYIYIYLYIHIYHYSLIFHLLIEIRDIYDFCYTFISPTW